MLTSLKLQAVVKSGAYAGSVYPQMLHTQVMKHFPIL